MKETTHIRILEKDNNRRGDLFGRLMADLFVALGYEQPRLNVHKSGREIDLSTEHRVEPRGAVAECKATADPIGGDEVNKFVGALDAERKGRSKKALTGYFVSIAGFKETAVEQERQGRRTEIILLTGSQVVEELVTGRILIPKERATELAGRCCAELDHLALDPEAELLAHERGWIWGIYYTQGKARTHFALIHSDGTPLARELASEVIAADRECGGSLYQLACLNAAPPNVANTDEQIGAALGAYRKYLASECGDIQLDGMPADADVGSRRLRLESLFVPLHLDFFLPVGGETRRVKRQAVGIALAEHSRLALLAAPGGGKSTLLKRLAVAYADPSRREEADDDLPQRDWLPLFFRCRELRDLARGSFAELLEALSQREPVRQHALIFRAAVDRALLAGRVLLLVDGLDEISDPGDRAAFVCTLRAALQAYPGTAIVVTSREAGFRHVAAHLAPVCTQATLSPFDAEDIRRLSVAWHREVVGDTEKVRTDAEQLALTIAENDRILRLAVNPLLLTTLLLVKRWVGSLPTRRVVLYGKAVELLLMTWNTEGHEPIPEDEALPQLCYVASAMMLGGVQKISRPHLAALLQEARDALPTELGYVRGTVDQFIHRVEDRSSLLMMTGYDVEDGGLVEFFEFRHLTFQEFLTAKAMVGGWHPRRQDGDSLVSVLEPYFETEQWREVIPLAAVLGGKETEALIRGLTEKVGGRSTEGFNEGRGILLANLCSCLADEAAARPQTIRAAVRELVRNATSLVLSGGSSLKGLARGRYGADFRAEAGNAFLSGPPFENSGDALITAVWSQTPESEDNTSYAFLAGRFADMLDAPEEIARCEGALGVGRLCLDLRSAVEHPACLELLRRAGPMLIGMLEGTLAESCSAAYALGGLGGCRIWAPEPEAESEVQGRLLRLWREKGDETMKFQAARAFTSQPLTQRGEARWSAAIPAGEIESMLRSYSEMKPNEQLAALIVFWHLGAIEDTDLKQRAQALGEGIAPEAAATLRQLLGYLGALNEGIAP